VDYVYTHVKSEKADQTGRALIVLRLARGERAVQDEHFELLTVAKTSKMAEI